jgi:hypothetical protein
MTSSIISPAASSLLAPRLLWPPGFEGAAEAEFVAVGIAVHRLPDAIRVGFLLGGREAPLADLCYKRVEVVPADSSWQRVDNK